MLARPASARTELLASMKAKTTLAYAHQASRERTVTKISLTAKRTHVRLRLLASIYLDDSTANVHSTSQATTAERVRNTYLFIVCSLQ